MAHAQTERDEPIPASAYQMTARYADYLLCEAIDTMRQFASKEAIEARLREILNERKRHV
jgi:hypothetical protein